MKKFRKPDRSRGGEPRRAGPPQKAAPSGRCVVGIHAVNELLKVRPRSVDPLILRDRYFDHPELKQLGEQAEDAGVRVTTQPQAAIDRLANANQGVIAFSNAEPEADWNGIKTAEKAVIVALDEIEDPHNLGAIVRTAWLMGALAVLTPERRSAHLAPAVSKVAQGGSEHVPVVSDGPLNQQLQDLKQHGYWVIGLSHKAKQTIHQLKIPEKVVWVLGSESGGLRKSVEGVCDDFVSIPQSSPDASYNVSVAAGIALAETFRQRTNSQ